MFSSNAYNIFSGEKCGIPRRWTPSRWCCYCCTCYFYSSRGTFGNDIYFFAGHIYYSLCNDICMYRTFRAWSGIGHGHFKSGNCDTLENIDTGGLSSHAFEQSSLRLIVYATPLLFSVINLYNQVLISLGSGPLDQLFGGGNSSAFAVGGLAAFVSGLVAIIGLPCFISLGPFCIARKFDRNVNFGMWQLKMEAILVQDGVDLALQGAEKIPDGMSEEDFVGMDKKARSSIILNLSDEVLRKVATETTAKSIEGTSIISHLDKFDSLVMDLENIDAKIDDEDKALLLFVHRHSLVTGCTYVSLHLICRDPCLVEEMRAIGAISVPAALTGLVLYSRAMVSTLFLGYLGELELASGSLSIGFANITGYSVLSGLAMGMEPICGQAFGAKQRKLLGLTLQRAILLLLSASVPISFLWRNMRRILSWCGQDEQIASAAHVFITFAIPDLFLLSFLHPLRVYLRSQNVTFPVTCCSFISVALHIPLNYLLVVRLRMGIAGVALAMVWTNLNLFVCLLLFVLCSGACKDSWVRPSMTCLRGWSALLKLAVPSCVSVCLEWWWYELMILLSGLLPNPKAAVASMGILIQTTSLVYVFPSALSFGVSARVGNVLGANHPAKARTATMVSLTCALMLGLAAMAFTTSMRHQWGRLFTDDAEILKLTALALPIAGLCELGNCPQTTGCGVLRGSARPTTGANINLGSFYLVGTPVAVLLGFFRRMGFPGLWLGLLAAQASCATLMAYALARTDWMVEAEKARELTKPSNSPPPLIPLT
ncbi:unnamed protein product, partial [Musa textilis]